MINFHTENCIHASSYQSVCVFNYTHSNQQFTRSKRRKNIRPNIILWTKSCNIFWPMCFRSCDYVHDSTFFKLQRQRRNYIGQICVPNFAQTVFVVDYLMWSEVPSSELILWNSASSSSVVCSFVQFKQKIVDVFPLQKAVYFPFRCFEGQVKVDLFHIENLDYIRIRTNDFDEKKTLPMPIRTQRDFW